MESKSKKILAIVIAIVIVAVAFTASYYLLKPKTDLPTMDLTAISPVTSLESEQLSILSGDYKAIGLPVKVSVVAPSVTDTWSSAAGTPPLVDLGWVPDWPDPVAQQMVAITDHNYGGLAGDLPWFDNATVQKIDANVEFEHGPAQLKNVSEVYNITYDCAPWVWLPNPDTYYFVQPYVNNFTYNEFNGYFYNMLSYNSSYSKDGLTAPTNSNLTDISQTAPPDALDPATGFYTQDGPLFTAIYQPLFEFNGTSVTNLVGVIANYNGNINTTSMKTLGITSNYQNYTINLRNDVKFNNTNPVNATTVWFSIYREIVMGQGPGISNYIGLLFNSSLYGETGYAIPYGLENAMNASSNSWLHNKGNASQVANETAHKLAYILSNFNYNSTDMALMKYPNQAVSVNTTYNVHINTIKPYPYMLYDLAEWWGDIVDPANVDAHPSSSGVLPVAPNTPNSYFNTHGMIGTGPYEITSVGTSFSTIVITKNPHYWGSSSLPAVAQPAKIATITIDYGLSHTDRVDDFTKNSAQISLVSPSYIGEIAGVSPYKSLPFDSYFRDFGSQPSVFYVAMNTQVYPTNITDLRLAMEYATNYTALLKTYEYNGHILANESLGPISPNFKTYYDPSHLPLYTFNISKAESLLNKAGLKYHFFVTLPNGTVLGDKALKAKAFIVLPMPLTMHNLKNDVFMALTKIYSEF